MPRTKYMRQSKAWSPWTHSQTSVTSPATHIFDMLPYVDNPMELTIMRIIGFISVSQQDDGWNPNYVEFGITTMTEDAYVTGGIAAAPIPHIDHIDWLGVFEVLMTDQMGYNGSVYRKAMDYVRFDLKTRRRLSESGQYLVGVVRNDSGGTVNIKSAGRVLLSNVGGAADIG